MPFRLHKEAKQWFKGLEGRLGSAPMFDMYYYCLLAGLAERRLADAKDSDTAELVENFPGEFASKGRLLIATFLNRELRRQAVSLEDRNAVNAAIGRLVDPNTPSRLSADGMKIMNRYAFAGFEVMVDWFPERPQRIETFLLRYHRSLSEALQD